MDTGFFVFFFQKCYTNTRVRFKNGACLKSLGEKLVSTSIEC